MSQKKKNKSTEELRAERERYMIRKMLEGRYKQRFTIAKEGKIALNKRDYKTMVYKFNEYLKILADTYEVDSIYEIKPESFDKKKDVTELLVISQIYWELSKLYDQSSKATDKIKLCLRQFVRFTVDMQYQSLNSEIVRKELKRRKFKQLPLFKSSLESIYREAKGCYLATHFSQDENLLMQLRALKNNVLLQQAWGVWLVRVYYKLSPRLVRRLENHAKFSNLLNYVITPILYAIAHWYARNFSNNSNQRPSL